MNTRPFLKNCTSTSIWKRSVEESTLTNCSTIVNTVIYADFSRGKTVFQI